MGTWRTNLVRRRPDPFETNMEAFGLVGFQLGQFGEDLTVGLDFDHVDETLNQDDECLADLRDQTESDQDQGHQQQPPYRRGRVGYQGQRGYHDLLRGAVGPRGQDWDLSMHRELSTSPSGANKTYWL
jgi:hypothetical protein